MNCTYLSKFYIVIYVSEVYSDPGITNCWYAPNKALDWTTCERKNHNFSQTIAKLLISSILSYVDSIDSIAIWRLYFMSLEEYVYLYVEAMELYIVIVVVKIIIKPELLVTDTKRYVDRPRHSAKCWRRTRGRMRRPSRRWVYSTQLRHCWQWWRSSQRSWLSCSQPS